MVLGLKAKKSKTAHPNQVTRYKEIALLTDDNLRMRSHVELEVDHVAVVHDVVLALHGQLGVLAAGGL